MTDDFGTQEVLNHIGIAVDVGGGDVGVFDEVELPEPVVAGDAGGFAKAGFGKANLTSGTALDVVFGASLTDNFGKFALGPVAVLAKEIYRNGEVLNGVGPLGFFENFIG